MFPLFPRCYLSSPLLLGLRTAVCTKSRTNIQNNKIQSSLEPCHRTLEYLSCRLLRYDAGANPDNNWGECLFTSHGFCSVATASVNKISAACERARLKQNKNYRLLRHTWTRACIALHRSKTQCFHLASWLFFSTFKHVPLSRKHMLLFRTVNNAKLFFSLKYWNNGWTYHK